MDLLQMLRALPDSGADGFRNEHKYICSTAELAELQVPLTALLMPDPHSGAYGRYRVRSLYFDTYDDRLVRENEDGTSPREKWRIRSYNLDRSYVALECKMHEGDRVRKQVCPIPAALLDEILLDRYPQIGGQNPPLLNRFLMLHYTQLLHPSVIVDYIRTPFIFPEGNVRVTFDCGIASGADPSRYWDPKAAFRPVLPAGAELLEVKFDSFLPDPVFNAIQMRDMQRTSFSKYYLSRRYHL